MQARSPRAVYGADAVVAHDREGAGTDRGPGSGARRRSIAAPTGSVWNWLKRRPVGKLSKDEIDNYIRAERDSWGDA